MSNDGIGILVGLIVLAVTIPIVARIRHPDQKPLAAYLIFMTVFMVAAMVLFSTLGWLTGMLGLGAVLSNTGPALILTILSVPPALALAIWQVRKPPLRRGPPN
jgi:hypothetical protein